VRLFRRFGRFGRFGAALVDVVTRIDGLLEESPADATMTGIIDRLERGGWVARDRGTADRRAVLIRALRDRNSELLHLYSGMNTSLDQI
jgi:hypothetical protein